MPDAYLVAGTRTPIGRYGGALANVRPDDLAAHVLVELVRRNPSVDWEHLDDVLIGCANQAGEDNRNVGRMAVLLAGLPVGTPGVTVNRLCGSGLDAVLQGARAIQSNQADLVIAGGVESMTRAPFAVAKTDVPWSRNVEVHDTTIGWRFVNSRMAEMFGTDSMPETAQNVAEAYDISREDQDSFALRSQERAARAIESGRFDSEITPVEVPAKRGPSTVVSLDEHPRATSMEALGDLKAIVAGGNITAGNSAGVNDGSAAVLLASERSVERFGLEPLAKVTSGTVVGVEPALMGIGPLPATERLLSRTNLRTSDIDIFEFNEAFAAQTLAVTRGLGLPDDAEHVNPNGGAIALGHPLGASGARLALTAALELRYRNAKRAMVSMCVGVGQGISVLLEEA
ncbi:3-oxoadipyl-CoA thiolase [Micromonospora inyonensis]|uniref:Beta-ketoadipyl-CoA thiolase n=1 Tax=Micromonospora inyonensis TaxID=47866 RepID=A0A1C6SDS8_9ACTN|nr:3-oxoadipyl-CoA thiolase [Micromonospora inyonensis]SCL27459.1 acetyl-CoA C-acetyltransferase [Micromonospora inyonensis]